MKVLFLSQWYPHRYDNMAGLFVQKHAEAVSLYCDVATLYVHADENIKTFEIIVNKHQNIIEYLVYYPIAKASFFHKIIKSINYLRAYKKGFKLYFSEQGKPDIIQANIFTRTAFIAYLIKIIYNIPYVVIEHWTRYFREKTFINPLHKRLSILVAKKAAAVMPVTKHLQTWMEKHGMKNNNYHVINNVVDDIFFQNISSASNKKIKISNITCFDDAHKNLSGILNVVKRLSLQRKDFEVYLIGDGVDFEMIKNKSKEMELDNKFVFFTGTLTGKELVRHFQESHFTILFSNYENIPVVISESFVCGKPVISTNVGGINEHINEKNGILIEREDETALFDSINYMMEHLDNYDSEEIKASAKVKYSYHFVGKHIFEIYSNILSK